MKASLTVLFVSYNGLFEPVSRSQVLPYLQGLARRGARFCLVTHERPDVEVSPAERRAVKADLRAAGIEWYPRTYHKNPKYISTIFDLLRGTFLCARLLMSRTIDIVHARGATPAAMVLPLIFATKKRFLFDMRSSLAEAYADAGIWKTGGFWYRLVQWVEARAMRQARWIVVETEAHRCLILQSPKEPALSEKLKVIPCCVDMERFADLTGLGEDGPWELVYLGSLSGWYKFDEMLAFYKVARESWGTGRLVFLTNGQPEEIQRWAVKAGIPKTEVVVDAIPFAGVPMRLVRGRAGIVFTAPGRRLESMPVKVGEYLAAGLPLVVNAGMGDTEQLVRSHKVGVVVETFTEEGYRRAVAELDTLLRINGSLAHRCRQVARERLSLKSGVDEYWTLYETVGEGMPEAMTPMATQRRD